MAVSIVGDRDSSARCETVGCCSEAQTSTVLVSPLMRRHTYMRASDNDCSIDLLKIDIESHEWAVLPDILVGIHLSTNFARQDYAIMPPSPSHNPPFSPAKSSLNSTSSINRLKPHRNSLRVTVASSGRPSVSFRCLMRVDSRSHCPSITGLRRQDVVKSIRWFVVVVLMTATREDFQVVKA